MLRHRHMSFIPSKEMSARRQKKVSTFYCLRNMKNRFPFYRIFMFSFPSIVRLGSTWNERKMCTNKLNTIQYLISFATTFDLCLLFIIFLVHGKTPEPEVKMSGEKSDKRKYCMICFSLHEKLLPSLSCRFLALAPLTEFNT